MLGLAQVTHPWALARYRISEQDVTPMWQRYLYLANEQQARERQVTREGTRAARRQTRRPAAPVAPVAPASSTRTERPTDTRRTTPA